MIQHSLKDLRNLDQREGTINDDCKLIYWSSKTQALCYPLHSFSGVQSPGVLPHTWKSFGATLDSWIQLIVKTEVL